MNARLVVLVVLFGFAGTAFGDEPAKDTKNRKIPDPAYFAQRGDEAYLVLYYKEKRSLVPVFCCLYSFAYEKNWRALSINDRDETADLINQRAAYFVDSGVSVLVLEIETFPKGDVRPTCATCRILDGPHKGEKVLVPRFSVGRPIPNPDYEGR